MENKIFLLLSHTVAGESSVLVNYCCWRVTLLVTQWLASHTEDIPRVCCAKICGGKYKTQLKFL